MLIEGGEYELTARLQETPLSLLLRARRTSDSTPVVIKVLREEYPGPLALARMRHEHAILQSLDLPCVARTLGLLRLKNGLALVLEDAGPTSLDQLIRNGGLDLETKLRIASALAGVVAAVHAKNIIHKDIKPDHFFLSPETPDDVKLIDFGIATRLSHDIRDAPPGELEGSLAYIAPEQTGRANRVVDERSDLYSLGATLYEVFTGRLPFESADPHELIHSHLVREPQPPHELDPSLPAVVSDIVLRLLKKAAEERYQSASGLRADLERCLHGLTPRGHVEPFALAQRDASGKLAIPRRLIGRERELEQLGAAVARVQEGSAEVVLLTGYSGVGKSAVVRELHRQVVRTGRFISGKFDSLNRTVPYTAVIQACRELVQTALAESPEALAGHVRELTEALGDSGRVLSELFPDIELLVGPQPPVPDLGPSESQSRFEAVFQRFLAVFASADAPLLLCLDDLQWADAASLALLEAIASGPSGRHLLIIGCYRDNEMTAGHPLLVTLEEIRRAGVPVHTLELAPLELAHVTELVKETLAVDGARAEPLAASLHRKTGGNPFFVGQLLTSLHRDGVLRFDAGSGAWTWDLAEIETHVATDNVAAFLLSRLRLLPEETQRVLRLAACRGHEFDIETILWISEFERPALSDNIWAALREGLIVPLDGNYRFTGDEEIAGTQALNARFRFAHDHVQQAAYALMDEAEQTAAHLWIGRLLMLGSEGAALRDERLFEIVDHMNRGTALLGGALERRKLAELDLLAGEKARSRAASAAAVQYLRTAIALCDGNAFEGAREIGYRAHLLLTECEYLDGDVEAAFRAAGAAERLAEGLYELVTARNLTTWMITNEGRLLDALAHAIETAKLLGVSLPAPDDRGAALRASGETFARIQAALSSRPADTLATLPRITDRHEVAIADTLARALPPAYQARPDVMMLIVLTAVERALPDHTAPAYFYANYGVIHSALTGDHAAALRFGELALALAKRHEDRSAAGTCHFLFGAFISPGVRHISRSFEHLREAVRRRHEGFDMTVGAYAASFLVAYRMYAGDDLDDLAREHEELSVTVEGVSDVINRSFGRVASRTIAVLRGHTRDLGRFDGEVSTEEELEASLPPPVAALYFASKAFVRLLAGRHDEALLAIEAGEKLQRMPGFFYNVWYAFYRALALAQKARAAPPAERDALLEQLRAGAAAVARWAEQCPDNHAHRHALLAAEIAALSGDPLAAMADYDRAIAAAARHGFLHEQALANELCGLFHRGEGRERIAQLYLTDAIHAYERWGAAAKVTQLRALHPGLGDSKAPLAGPMSRRPGRRSDTSEKRPSTDARANLAGRLDVATAIRVTETIASELVTSSVLERLMTTLLESAGAERGFLVIARGGETPDPELQIEGSIQVNPDEVRAGLGQRLDTSSDLAVSVVRYVARSMAPLVLSDAADNPRFAADPYVARARPKSLLCLPMMHAGALRGVFYLEHRGVTNAFSPARVELLQFLAAQAAAALEKARLYGELETATLGLQRAKKDLEEAVLARTRELQRALSELVSEMDLARKIQTLLLPKETRVGDFDVATAMVTAASVGGDYYDIVPCEGADWVLIGDVSGHGVPAGLTMMMVQTALRTLLSTAPAPADVSPSAVLSMANRALRNNLERLSEDQYVTITALSLQKNRVRFAGLHQDLLVYRRASSTLERVETSGAWLGILDDIASLLEDRTLELSEGDSLLLFTDGLTEARVNGKMIGTAGVGARFHALCAAGKELPEVLRGMLDLLGGKPAADDIALLVLRHAPSRRA